MGALTHQDLLAQFAAEFMAENPDVLVEPLFQGTYGNLYQKLIAAVTAGRPPAMAMMFESWTTRLHYRGHVNRRLVALDFPAAEAEGCQPGALLHQGGEEVGALTSIGRIPLGERMRGIAMVRHAAIQDGGNLSLTADGLPEIAMGLLATDLGGGQQ